MTYYCKACMLRFRLERCEGEDGVAYVRRVLETPEAPCPRCGTAARRCLQRKT